MVFRNYIIEAQYYGRRLESIRRVARRWKISMTDAAELIVNVEEAQSENRYKNYNLNKKRYKEKIEGKTFYKKEEILFDNNEMEDVFLEESNKCICV